MLDINAYQSNPNVMNSYDIDKVAFLDHACTKTYDRISADCWLSVLELLLYTRDSRLTVGTDEGAENKFRVNGMSANNLTSDSDQCPNPD